MEVKKTTGEKEAFAEDKLYSSIISAGVEHSLAQEVLRMVTKDKNQLKTTDSIHAATEQALLKKEAVHLAAKYNLKRAIVDLGPSGYPFEQYIARVFQAYGYKTETNQMLKGRCVTHEIDIVARRGRNHFMIECKHHHFSGAKTKLQVALYTYARFNDLLEVWSREEGTKIEHHRAWLVTNTRATKDAIAYSNCVGMKVLAWHYPKNKGLNRYVEYKGLYPITVLPQLGKRAKQAFLKNNIILITDMQNYNIAELVKLTRLNKKQVQFLHHAATKLLTDV